MLTRIASVHFFASRADRKQWGKEYVVPAQKLNDEPFILSIDDAVQHWEGDYQSSTVVGKRRQNNHLVTGESIAADLIQEWTQNGVGRTDRCHPGLWIIRDRVAIVDNDGKAVLDIMQRATFRRAEPAEFKAMWQEDEDAARAADAEYAKYVIGIADRFFNNPKGSQAVSIMPIQRAAAEIYAPAAPWLVSGSALIPAVCPYCQFRAPAASIKCPRCHEIIDAAGYARLQADEKRIIKEATRELQTSAA
jgi:hypothetical protein